MKQQTKGGALHRLWQALPWHDTLLAGEPWPETREVSDLMSSQFGRLKRLVTEVRYVTSELPGNDRYPVLYQDDSLVADNVELIQKLSHAKSVEHTDQARGLRLAASGRDAWLDISDELLYEHQTNLEKRLAEARNDVAALEQRLSNAHYVERAPAHLVEESRDALASKKALVERLEDELTVLG
jgi:valyl-tRNA synthetase